MLFAGGMESESVQHAYLKMSLYSSISVLPVISVILLRIFIGALPYVLVNVDNAENCRRRMYRLVEYIKLVFESEAELVLMKFLLAQLPVISVQAFVYSFQ